MQRQGNIELARLLAFIMIAAIHVSGPYLTGHHIVGEPNWLFANFLDGFSRIAVGVFVLITGYGMCTQTDPRVGKRLKNLLIPLPFFLAPTLYLYLREGFSPAQSVLWFLKDLPVDSRWFFHLWYVNVILVVYILAPWLNRFIATLDKSAFRRLIAVSAALFSGVSTVNYLVGHALLADALTASRLGVFALYYFIGAYLRLHADLSKFSRVQKFCAFLSLNLLVVLFGAWYNSRLSPLFAFGFLKDAPPSYPFGGFVGEVYDMNCLLVVLAAAAFFVWILSLDFQSKAVNALSKLTYGAYLIHIFWLYQLQNITHHSLWTGGGLYPAKCLAYLAAVCALSLLSAFVLNLLGRGIWTVCKRFLIRPSA